MTNARNVILRRRRRKKKREKQSKFQGHLERSRCQKQNIVLRESERPVKTKSRVE